MAFFSALLDTQTLKKRHSTGVSFYTFIHLDKVNYPVPTNGDLHALPQRGQILHWVSSFSHGSGAVLNDDMKRGSSRVTCAERYRYCKRSFGADIPGGTEEIITYRLATTAVWQ